MRLLLILLMLSIASADAEATTLRFAGTVTRILDHEDRYLGGALAVGDPVVGRLRIEDAVAAPGEPVRFVTQDLRGFDIAYDLRVRIGDDIFSVSDRLIGIGNDVSDPPGAGIRDVWTTDFTSETGVLPRFRLYGPAGALETDEFSVPTSFEEWIVSITLKNITEGGVDLGFGGDGLIAVEIGQLDVSVPEPNAVSLLGVLILFLPRLRSCEMEISTSARSHRVQRPLTRTLELCGPWARRTCR